MGYRGTGHSKLTHLNALGRGLQSYGLIGNTNAVPGMRKLRTGDSLCTSEGYIETMILSFRKPQQDLVSLSVSSFHSLVITIKLTRHVLWRLAL